MAGALLAMAARLSSPAQNGTDPGFFSNLFVQGEQLSQELLTGSQEDSHAFQTVRSAYQLPRQTDVEKAVRQQAIQSAWLQATRVPLANAGGCLSVLELSLELGSRVNPKVLSDLRCALLLAQAGLLGCLENVQINLPSITDAALAAHFAGQAGALRERLARLDLAAVLDSQIE
jgi:formiminotetrahydrofolate cyclodeaminase